MTYRKRTAQLSTKRTITATVMFALIRMSSMNAGIGVIIAITMPRTANGAPISLRFPNRDFFFAPLAGFNATACDFGATPRAVFGAETGAGLVAAAMSGRIRASGKPDVHAKSKD